MKANTVSVIGGFAGYQIHTCYASDIPDVKVSQAPANGAIQILNREIKLGKDTSCPGANVRALVYVYTPKKGFKGADEVSVDVPWTASESARPSTLTYTFRIKVE